MNCYDIFTLRNEEFEDAAIRLFRMQYRDCAIYHRYVQALQIDVDSVDKVEKIPMLPISFFKTDKVISGCDEYQMVFESSGTTSDNSSKHYVTNLKLYEQSLTCGFHNVYGRFSDYCILALLPHYLERQNSSLVYMVRQWVSACGHSDSGFFLHNTDELYRRLCSLRSVHQPTILIGVTFALLDFAERYEINNFPELIVMETGGMKGRGIEINRKDVHRNLRCSFGSSQIHSEYGMTELLSQAYSKSDGRFYAPAWMKIFIYDSMSPLSYLPSGKRGGIAVVDLANRYSCGFVLTEDEGILYSDGSFEVLGRLPSAPLRGCSMLIE
jgi:phenylacetate-coenzyme A ligase PaaK-like adenylate-forming protein